MSHDIELGPLLPSSASSSEETLYTRYGSAKVHRGYGASRLPLRPSPSAGFAAGQNYQKIFEGHLGNAAADPNNPVGNWFYDQIYGKKNDEAQRLLEESYKDGSFVPTEELKPGIVLPYSNNIGPGNSLQPARTRADSIAQGHDIHYKDAKKDSDVLSADREAISQFIHEVVYPENPISQLQAAVGAVGLGAKHGFESLSGKVFYGKYVFTF